MIVDKFSKGLVNLNMRLLQLKDLIYIFHVFLGFSKKQNVKQIAWKPRRYDGKYLFSTAWKVSVFGVFLVHIFPHLDWIARDAEYLFVFSLNAGKNGPEKLGIWKLFTQCRKLSLAQYSMSFTKAHRDGQNIEYLSTYYPLSTRG